MICDRLYNEAAASRVLDEADHDMDITFACQLDVVTLMHIAYNALRLLFTIHWDKNMRNSRHLWLSCRRG